ncbi:DNA adenine methylase [Sphingomonas changnyeongensis]|uniref:site-specific DNA-methyltransferase (adenine-specific) n=1 Tax=Sphingomonas changnyeongensis TaxID=2698679 RepID=A0A7Z2NYQ2_9SPHN|nr:DNA adenine methylase [Sphingomonas changnyeongensis]QHL91855.1 DNA adenine methylase [Sphingomonas changnyeongensis]
MESSPNTAVRPVRPIAPYIGGKRNLARRIVKLIETIDHSAYFEPFVGMGGIFLRRTSRPKTEAINDISGDVATLFRVLQEHYAYFVDMLRWRLTSRAEFDRLLSLPGDRLTDLQRAARFLYVQRLAFGGKVAGRHFGVQAQAPARFDITRLEPMLAEIHERLSGVVIEQLDYGAFIDRYDHPGALFYLDPPYWGCETDYGPKVFTRGDFETLADQLALLKGRFVLSINDTAEIRTIFSKFDLQPVDLTYQISGKPTSARELIIQPR